MEEAPDQRREDDSESADPAAAEVAATVEAILFATDTPLKASRIVQVGELPGQAQVKQAIETLNGRYEQVGCAFRIEQIAGGYQMLTLSEYHDVLSRLLRSRSEPTANRSSARTSKRSAGSRAARCCAVCWTSSL